MDLQKTPNHIALIPDGNRRWAKQQGLASVEGHRAGGKRFIEIAKAARQAGVHTLTGWAFSTENWERDDEEVGYLMEYFLELLKENEQIAHQDDVQIHHLGRRDRLPTFLRTEIERVEESTKHHQKHILNICLDYGGQDEIIRAINKILQEEHKKDSISKEEFEQYLDTVAQPYPNVDLLIRTSGEQRTSGLLPFQMAYAEFYFEPDPMPEFTTQKFHKALESYANRDRRFGGNTTS